MVAVADERRHKAMAPMTEIRRGCILRLSTNYAAPTDKQELPTICPRPRRKRRNRQASHESITSHAWTKIFTTSDRIGLGWVVLRWRKRRNRTHRSRNENSNPKTNMPTPQATLSSSSSSPVIKHGKHPRTVQANPRS
jgi:hypothetical protein